MIGTEHRRVPARDADPTGESAAPGAPASTSRFRLAEASSTFDNALDLNLVGLRTLYVKEVRRFLKVLTQTLLAPVVTTLVFLAIFALALGRSGRELHGMSFLEFLAPGLIMMAIVQNAFANTSSSLMIAKIQGNVVDYLVPPLSSGELLFGLAMGGVTRGVLVGLAVFAVMLPFVDLGLPHPFLVGFYILAASLMLSLLGILAALWAEKFDQMAMVTNFIVTPLSFLSGTFYSIADLPWLLHDVALANPFFYMIDGIRYGITGHADGTIAVGIVVLCVANLALWWFALHLFRIGYRLKA
jgi:ABC-2 type transport system permease protein